LEYGLENNLHTLCITDHFWDERVPGVKFGQIGRSAANGYAIQNYNHIRLALPLPKHEGVRYLFGCETEMDKNFTIGVSKQVADELDFIIVPTTHMHMKGLAVNNPEDDTDERRAELWVKRFQAVLDSGLPLKKVGIPHLTTALFVPNKDWEGVERCLQMISDDDMKHLFGQAAKAGVGIELNFEPSRCAHIIELVLRPYRIAIECGCKFYLGSDAHTVGELQRAMPEFEKMIDLLDLTEDQKYVVPRKEEL
jgi:histidinol phosphatase-like PHP family hydrolase